MSERLNALLMLAHFLIDINPGRISWRLSTFNKLGDPVIWKNRIGWT